MTAVELSKEATISIDDFQYSQIDVVDALNYGTSPLFSSIANVWKYRQDLKGLSRMIDNSLLRDLETAMFGNEKTYLYPQLDQPILSLKRHSQFSETIRSLDSRLYLGAVFRYCQHSQLQTLSVPYSYIIKELCELVGPAKDNVTVNLKSKAIRKFRADREQFWETAFSNPLA
jgi:hypothetical protein